MAEIVVTGLKPAEPGVDLDPSIPESGDQSQCPAPSEPFYMDGLLHLSDDVDIDDPDDDPAP